MSLPLVLRKTVCRFACVGLLLVAQSAASDPGRHEERDHGDRAGVAVEGRRIFLRENCYSCHGGRAGGGMGPNLRDERPDREDIADAVLNGRPTGMPSYRNRLTSTDIANLVAYIRSLRTAQEPVFTHWWEGAANR